MFTTELRPNGYVCQELCYPAISPRRSSKKKKSTPRARGAKPNAWSRVRRRVLERDRGLCRSCGRPAAHVHHIVLRSAGGPDKDWNGAAVCRVCHDWIHEDAWKWAPILLEVVRLTPTEWLTMHELAARRQGLRISDNPDFREWNAQRRVSWSPPGG